MGENSIKYEKELHYVEKGAGQPVIFIHGTLTDFRIWQFQLEKFAQKYHVITYSNDIVTQTNGLGIDDNNLTNNVEDSAKLVIKNLSLGSAHLIGHCTELSSHFIWHISIQIR